MSKARAWTTVAIVCALIVALGVGLAFCLTKDDRIKYVEVVGNCPPPPAPPSSARLMKESPIYVEPTKMKEGSYRFLSVASDSEPCSKIGTEIMVRYAGSAVDGAIAAILCVGVYNPQSCGIGGGFFMTYYKRSERKAYSIMAREMAPSGAHKAMYLKKGVSSQEGAMAIGIPGQVKGLYEAWKLGGKLPWSDLFQPAIRMARDGFTVGGLLAKDMQNNAEYFERHANLKNMVTNSDTGVLYKRGETMRLPKLAQTLEKIASDPHIFYNGSLADDVSSDITYMGGIITTSDLGRYTAAVHDSLDFTMNGGYTVYTPPPPSSGAVILFILNILNGFNFTKNNLADVNTTVETLHKAIEAFKHGYSLRTNLGDADAENQAFKDKITELLTNMTTPAFGAERRARITDTTHERDYYNPTYSHDGSDAGTSHLSVLGPSGDAVSITSTINLHFGSKIVGAKTGIVFNNNMDDFSTPGTVNYFGIPASPANFIKPFKRPLSSMSPSVVVDANGDVKLVTGASGGSRIITSTAWSAIHTLWFELGMKEAIDYPRVHHQLMPETVRVEKRMPQAIIDGLIAKGHKFDVQLDSGSAVQAILQKDRDEIWASCDPTRYGITDGS